MRYIINSSLIPSSWFREVIFKTLNMYKKKEDLMQSPLAEFQRNWNSWGGRHKDLINVKDYEEALKKRLDDFIELYNDIKKNGYDRYKKPFYVYFDKDGFLNLYDGHHRKSILEYLKIDPLVEVETEWQGIDVDKTRGKDFPLEEELANRFKGQKYMYQCVPDDRLKDFKHQRLDEKQRIDFIQSNLTGKNILDIGCSEGVLSHSLASCGYNITANETDRMLMAVARYLATINNLHIDCCLGDWKDLIRKQNTRFDNILYLSVLHNEVNLLGEEQAFKNLRLFRGKTDKLFIEVPDINVQPDWSSVFNPAKLYLRLEKETGMKIKEIYNGYRPIILLVNPFLKEEPKIIINKKDMDTIIVENVNGLQINVIKGDFPIDASIQETKQWEPRTTQFIKDNLKKGQIFLDIGASIGYYTLLASKLVGTKDKVFAFEPSDENYEVLKENIKLNNLKNVKCLQKALSNYCGTVKLYKGKAAGQHSLLKEKNSTDEYVSVIAEQYDKTLSIVPDMIKIDVEGAEKEVLLGMKKVLETKKELTIIMEDYSGKTVEWLIKKYGFKIVNTEREYGNYMLVKNQNKIKTQKQPITFHLLGTWNTPTNKKEGVGYAFCPKIMHIAKTLKYLGHKVIFYGVEGSEVECDEFVQVLNKRELPTTLCVEDINHPSNHTFNRNAIEEIKKRKSPYVISRDILLLPNGRYQKEVADAVEIGLSVEIGIGYEGVFTDKRIFESYAWMHYIHGCLRQLKENFTDMVIPPIFDPNDFEYLEEKEDYFLFLGRVITDKGIYIAKQTVEETNKMLLIAGKNEGYNIKSPNIKELGFADFETRKKLLSKAKALFVPTIYLEPFGYVIMEAAMSGTPVITTDWGAFTETVVHGKTGYRCKTLDQFIWAAKNIDKIKPADCRKWAMDNFTMEKIAPMYQEYFEQLQNLYGRGWYAKNPERKNLDFLSKKLV
jgi:FkbM family methyltransferase